MTTQYEVIIAGAGPVGLMLACELALRDVQVLILEQATEATTAWKQMPLGMRGLNTSSVEAFDRRGLLDKLISDPARLNVLDKTLGFKRGGHFAGIGIDANKLDFTRHKYRIPHHTLVPAASSMEQIESILSVRANELGVTIKRGNGFAGIVAEDPSSILIRSADGIEYRGSWLVGCDGGHSAVRKAANIEFLGTDAKLTAYSIDAEIENADKLKPGFQITDTGMYVTLRPGTLHVLDFDGGAYQRKGNIPIEHLQAVLSRITGTTDVVIKIVKHSAAWTDRSKIATTYSKGRVFLAGDACHVHPPFGAQGLNAGLGDSVNLGWKLALAIQKAQHGKPEPDNLLDTYQQERRPIAETIIEYTRAQMVLIQPDLYGRAVRKMTEALIATPDGANFYLDKFWGLSLRYPPVGGDCQHDAVGRSAPNFEFDNGLRLASMLKAGRGMLLNLGSSNDLLELVKGDPSHQIDVLSAPAKDTCGLEAVLIRPDGFVAWATNERVDGNASALQVALDKWFP